MNFRNSAAVFVLAFTFAIAGAQRAQATASVTTLASANIPASVVNGSSFLLTGPVLTEGTNWDIGTGTIILNTPGGFSFDPTSPVTVTVTRVAGNGSIITLSSATAIVTTDNITITVSGRDTQDGTTRSQITWSGIRVRPDLVFPLAVGNLNAAGSSATLTGINKTTTNFGTLTEVAGVATYVQVESRPDGLGQVVAAQTLAIGSSVTGYAISRDGEGNFLANVAASSWSLVDRTDEVVASDLSIAANSQSATFTAHNPGTARLHATYNSLTSVDSGILTVQGSTLTNSYNFTYTNRAALLAAGWDFIARRADWSSRDTEQTSGAIVSYNQAVHPGALRIPVDAGDLSGQNNTSRNSLFRDLPANWVSLRLEASLTPTSDFQQLRLALYQDDDSYLMVGHLFDQSKGGEIVDVAWGDNRFYGPSNPWSSFSIAYARVASANVRLRLDRDLNTERVTGFYSLDGVNWVSIGSASQVLYNPRVCIWTGGSAGGLPNCDVRRLEVITSLSPVTPMLVTQPQHLIFNAVAGENYTNSQQLRVTARRLQGGAGWDATSDSAWLTLIDPNGLTPSRSSFCDVLVDPSGLAPGIYHGSIEVTAPGLSSATTKVTLIVNPSVRARLSPWRDGKAGAMSVTVDDSDLSAFDDLRTNGFGGTYMIWGMTAIPTVFTNFYAAGMEMGTHTVNHYSAELDEPTLRFELEANIADVVAFTPAAQSQVVSFAWPWGTSDPLERTVAADYFLSARGYNVNQLEAPTPNDMMYLKCFSSHEHSPAPPADLKTVVDDAIAQGKWFNMVLHKTNDSNGAIHYAVGKDIWMAPQGSIAKYIVQRERTVITNYVESSAQIQFETYRLPIDPSSQRSFESAIASQDLVTFRVNMAGTVATSLTVNGVSTPFTTNANTLVFSTAVTTFPRRVQIGTGLPVLTVTADSKSRVYGGNNPALTGTLVGVAAGDNITATFTTTAFAGSAVGTYPIIPVFSDPNGRLGNYIIATNSGTLTVTQAVLTVTATGVNKVYDGTTAASVNLTDNRRAGDVLTASYTNASFANRNVGTGKTVSVSGLSLSGAAAGNYRLSSSNATATASITTRAITVTAAADNKIYDGTTNSTLVPTITLSSLATGDTASFSQKFANKNAGTGKTITPAGTVADGNGGANYVVSFAPITSGIITPRALVVSAMGQNRVYNGTTFATVTLSDNRVSGDVLTNSYVSAAFSDKNVGPGKVVNVSGIAVGGTDAANYTANSTASTTANITQAALTGTAENKSRAYGGANPSLTVSFSGFASGDTQSSALTGTPSLTTTAAASSPVGNYPITAALGTLSATNYAISFVNGTLTVTQAVLIVTATGVNKVYDGTTAAAVTLSDNRVAGDSLSTTYTNTVFASRNVGPGTPVSVTGLTIGGPAASNYTLAATTATTAANITARPITVTAATNSKTYDGTTTSIGVPAITLGSLATGDSASFTQAFSSKQAATGKTITPKGSVADGNGGTNYSITFVDSSSGTITPRALTLTTTGQNKVYDGTTATSVTFSDNRVNGDVLSFSYLSAAFANKNAGSAKTVNVSGITLSGIDAGNYTANSTATTTANITQAALTITAETQSRTYGATNPELTVRYSGFVAGDTQSSALTGTSSLTTTAVANSPVGIYPITATAGTLSAANYSFSFVNGELQVKPASLTGRAENKNRPYGQTNPVFTVSYSGFVNGETDSVISGSLASNCSAKTNSPSGTYPISVWGQTAPNYAINYVDGALSVTPAGLVVAAENASRAYGQTNPVFSAQITGWANGEDIHALGGTLSFSTSAQTNSPVGTYDIIPSGLTSTNYAITFSNATLTVTTHALIATAQNQSRAYGVANPTLTGTLTGVQDGDNISVTYSTEAGVGSAAGTYAIVPMLSDPNGRLGNYTVSTNNGTLTVTQAVLTVTATGINKVYDGTTAAAATLSDNRIAGDSLSTTYTNAVFASRNVGSGTPVSVTGLAIEGPAASNYTLAATTATTAANITARPITVTAATDSKTYDGTTTSIGVPAITLGSLATGDSASFTQAFNNKQAATGKTITPTGSIADGNQGNNYSVSFVNSTSGTITAKALTVSATGQNKVYDGTTDTSVSLSDNRVNGDVLSVNYTSAVFANKNAGSDKTVNVSGITLSGIDAGNYVASSTATATAIITQAPLTVTAEAQSRTYGAANPEFTVRYGGFVTGDTQSSALTGTPSLITTAVANSPVGIYPITATAGALSAANYSFSFVNGELQVNPATLTGTANNKSRPYGQTNPVFTVSYSGFVNGETDSVISGSLASNCSAKTNSPIGSYPISVWGQTAPNYAINYVDGALSVTPAELVVAAENASRAYGQTNPVFSAQITGWANGEDMNALGGTLSFSTSAQTNSPVGTYDIIPSGLTSTNYAITYSNATLTVTAHALIATAENQSRAYGAANPTLTGTLTGVQDGDNISVTYSTEAAVGSAAGTYAIVPVLSDPNGRLGNYTVSTNNGTLTVTQAVLTVTATGINKVYDGTKAAAATLSDNRIAGDSLSTTYTNAVFASRNVGSGTPVSVTGLAIEGPAASNYTLAATTATTVADITARPITVTAASDSKTYDGTTTSTGVPAITLGSLAEGDSANFTQSFNNKQAATGKTITPAGSVTDGTGGSNYSISFIDTTSGTIAARVLTVNALGQSKVYDGTTATTVTLSDNRVNGDILSATYANADFSDKNVGSGKVVNAIGISVSGIDAANYIANTSAVTLAEITPALLTVTASNASRVYGANNPALAASYSGFVAGDAQESALTGFPSLSTTAAALSPVGNYPITATTGSLSAANYTFQFAEGSLTISPATLVGTADNLSRPYGQTNPVFSVSYSGFVNGESASLVSGALAGACSAQTNSPVGSYPISVWGQSAPNYAISYVDGALSVTPAELVVQAENTSRAYGQTNPAFSATVIGLANEEDASVLSGELALSTSAQPNSPVGAYDIIPSGLTSTNYSITYSNGTLTVKAHTLTVMADNQSRMYGAANPTLTGVLEGLQNSDNITATYTTTASAGSPVGSYDIVPVFNDPNGSLPNYAVVTNGTLTVTQAILSVTATAINKVYDGTVEASVTLSDNRLEGDILTTSYTSAAFGDRHAGVGKTVTVSSLAISGPSAGNYTLAADTATATADITPRAITVSAVADSKTYDGSTSSAGVPLVTSGTLVSGDTSGFTQTFLTKNAGSGKAITPAGAVADGNEGHNYLVSFINNNSGHIATRNLRVTAITQNKVYDKTTATSVTLSDNRVTGDLLIVNYVSAAFEDGDAGIDKPISVNGISVNGPDAANYIGNYADVATANITPAPLIATIENKSRAYGKPNPDLIGTLTGVLSGDDITAAYATAATASSTVGTYAIVPVFTDPAGRLANYAVATNGGSLSVTQAVLTLTPTVANKVYDGTTTATVTFSDDRVPGDSLTASCSSAVFADKNVGVAKVVNLSGLAISGASAANYVLASTSGTSTADITPRAITVTAVADSKAYDATTTSGKTPTITSGTLANGDSASYTQAFANKNAGTAKTIVPSGAALDGNGGKNYSVTFVNNTSGTITAQALVVSATAHSKIYDGTSAAVVTLSDNRVAGDAITVNYANAGFADQNAGTAKVVSVNGITVSGVDAGNYTGNYSALTSGDIIPAMLTVTPNNESRTYGSTNPVLTIRYSGFVHGETQDSAITGSASLSTTALSSSPAGSYPITAESGTLAAANGNYVFSFLTGTLTVTPAMLTVTAEAKTRAYGAANPALTAVIAGFVNGDTQMSAVSGSPDLATAAETNSPVGSYSILATIGTLSAANYVFTLVDSTLGVEPAILTGTADNLSRLYGQTNPVFTVTYSGYVNGQDGAVLSGLLESACSAETNSPAGTYPISVWGQSAPNYTIEYVDGTLSVMPATLVVRANDSDRAYGQPNPEFSTTITGWANDQDSNVLSGTLVLTTAAKTNSPVGSYDIIPSGLSSTNYLIVFSNGTLRVTTSALMVTADNQTRTYGANNPVLTGTFSGVLNGDRISVSYATAADPASAVGTYDIVPTLGDPDQKLSNYTVAITNGMLTVTPAVLTLAADNKSRTYGTDNPELTGTLTGVQNSDKITASYATLANTASPVGNYEIVPALEDPDQKLGNYSVAISNSTLTVTAAMLEVTADNKSRTYGIANPALTGTLTGVQNSDRIIASYVTPANAASTVGEYEIAPVLDDPDQKLSNYIITSTKGHLVVTPAILAVLADNKSRTYGANNPDFTGTLAGVQNGDKISASYGTLANPSSVVGDYDIVPTLSDPDHKLVNYSVTSNNGKLTVTPRELLVTADKKSKTYGAANPTLTGSLVGVQNGDNITASYTTTATQQSPVGSYDIEAALMDPNGKLPNYSVHTEKGILTVSKASVLNALSSSQNPTVVNSNVVFTATLTPVAPATVTPTGYVQFFLNGIAYGGPVLLQKGVATVDSTFSSAGSNNVLAVYLGEDNYLGNVSSLTQVVSDSLPTLVTLHVQNNGDGTITISFTGVPGAQYLVQAMSELSGSKSIENLPTKTADLDGHWTFTEPVGNHSQRFYRAVKQ